MRLNFKFILCLLPVIIGLTLWVSYSSTSKQYLEWHSNNVQHLARILEKQTKTEVLDNFAEMNSGCFAALWVEQGKVLAKNTHDFLGQNIDYAKINEFVQSEWFKDWLENPNMIHSVELAGKPLIGFAAKTSKGTAVVLVEERFLTSKSPVAISKDVKMPPHQWPLWEIMLGLAVCLSWIYLTATRLFSKKLEILRNYFHDVECLGSPPALIKGNDEIAALGRTAYDALNKWQAQIDNEKNNSEKYINESVRIKQNYQQSKNHQEKLHAWVDTLEAGMGSIMKNAGNVIDKLQQNSQTIGSLLQQTRQKVSFVATTSQESTLNVQTVASAAEQLSASIAEISRQVTYSAQVAGQAAKAAEETDARVNGLANVANRINDVVQLIQDIANQTHLLALNATIEAARAGSKGFAVVASEVKNLATQTAKATEDITTQVESIQIATKDTVGAIRRISGIILQINQVSTAIASAVEEQTAATKEIARNVQHVWQGTSQVSNNIESVNQGAQETEGAVKQITIAANELSHQSRQIQNEVNKFIQEIRNNQAA